MRYQSSALLVSIHWYELTLCGRLDRRRETIDKSHSKRLLLDRAHERRARIPYLMRE